MTVPPNRVRPARIVLLAIAFLVATAPPSGSESKIIGRTESSVPVLRGRYPDSLATASPVAGDRRLAELFDEALDARPPTSTDEAARALARRMVSIYGGPHALEAWVDRGERRGTQSIRSPARLVGRFAERRQAGRVRLDVETGGYELSVGTGPEGAWQRFLGLVSDLPQEQVDEFATGRAHDERLLLGAAGGQWPAAVVRREGRDALLVWGSQGSATLFLPDEKTTRIEEIRFRDRSPMRDRTVTQSIVFSDWRELVPERDGRSGPQGTHIPFASRLVLEGETVEEDSLAWVDLLATFSDTVFARPGASERTTGASTRVVLPLMRQGEHHFARVAVNGGPLRTFLVDTGAGLTAISRELADTLGLALGDSLGIVGLGGGVEARSATLASLGFGSLVRKGVPCLVLDFSEMRRSMGLTVEGILGFSAINRYAVTFDFAHGALEVAENATTRPLSGGAARVRFEMLGGQVLVPVRVDGGDPLPFIVDTGAWVTFVPGRVGKKLDSARRVPGVPFVGADGRPLEAEAVRAKSLAVGTARVDRPIVLFATGGGARDPSGLTVASGERGILGANFLRRFRVTLDYPRNEIVLEPVRAPVGMPPGSGEGATDADGGLVEFGLVGPGIVLREDAGVARVAAVVLESAAARAGVEIGERVLAVDGRTVTAAEIDRAGALLAGPAGSDVLVRLVKNGGRERTLRLTRAPLL